MRVLTQKIHNCASCPLLRLQLSDHTFRCKQKTDSPEIPLSQEGFPEWCPLPEEESKP